MCLLHYWPDSPIKAYDILYELSNKKVWRPLF